MGCQLGKQTDKSSRGPEEKPAAYKTGTETLIDVKDYTLVQFDSRLPLTKRQVFSLLSSWRAVRREMAAVGTEIMVELLHSDPAVKKLFTEFQNLRTKEEMRASEQVEKQGLKVMSAIDDIVIHLDEYEYVARLVKRVAVTHATWIGRQPEMFLMIKQPFLKSVEAALGERFTENIRTVYEILIDFIILELIKDLSNSEQQNT